MTCPGPQRGRDSRSEGIRATGKHVLRVSSAPGPLLSAGARPLELGRPLLRFQEFCKPIVKQNHCLSFLKMEIGSILFVFL